MNTVTDRIFVLPTPIGVWVLLCLFPSLSAFGLGITINYTDADGEGFKNAINGPQRKLALEQAVAIWENHLVGTVELIIDAEFNNLADTILGETEMPAAWANHASYPEYSFWFVASLASELQGVSLPAAGPPHQGAHMFVAFNEDFVSVPTGSGKWYFGIDGLPPDGDKNFLSTALHEIAHNLGFVERINTTTGVNEPAYPGFPYWMLNFVVRRGATDLFFDEMTDAERLAALTSDEVYFSGPAIIAAQIPNPSLPPPDPSNPPVNALGEAKLFASAMSINSAIAHWDPFHYPDDRQMLMQYSSTDPIMNIGYVKELLTDLGWTFQTAPEIQVTPASHGFPYTHIDGGPSTAKTVTITSTGSVTLQVVGMALKNGVLNTDADQFQITNSTAPGPLASLQTRDVTIVFDPDSIGSKSSICA